jgi:hypothetical protein
VRLILLTLALVLFFVAGLPLTAPYDAYRLRLVAFGLMSYVASGYPW